jgi:hypothetical protein
MSGLPIWSTEGRAAALKRKARKQIEGAAPAERDRGAGGAAFNLWCAALDCLTCTFFGACPRLTPPLRYGKFNTMRENREAERAGCVGLEPRRLYTVRGR